MSQQKNHKKQYKKLHPIIAKCEYLLQIVRFHPYLSRNKLKVQFFAHTQVITLTPAFLHEIKTEFYTKRSSQQDHAIKCSRTDFIIARIAKELRIPVISYDQHLSVELRALVDYDAIWPHDLQIFKLAKQYLVDTNIIWGIISESDHNKHQAIMEMFQNDKIELIIPIQVLDELVELLDRHKNAKSSRKRSINRHTNRPHGSIFYSKSELKAF